MLSQKSWIHTWYSSVGRTDYGQTQTSSKELYENWTLGTETIVFQYQHKKKFTICNGDNVKRNGCQKKKEVPNICHCLSPPKKEG